MLTLPVAGSINVRNHRLVLRTWKKPILSVPPASYDHQGSGIDNRTATLHFILLGFPTQPAFWWLLFLVLLAAYLLTLVENARIILAIRSDGQVHKPMYFFLSNLSFLEMWYVTVISPKMLVDFLSHDETISFNGCMAQLYFFVTFVCTEYILLAVMAFDRPVAICNPLRYPVIMTNQLCGALAGGMLVLWARDRHD